MRLSGGLQAPTPPFITPGIPAGRRIPNTCRYVERSPGIKLSAASEKERSNTENPTISQASSSKSSDSPSETGKSGGRRTALGAVTLGAAAFAARRLAGGAVGLNTLEKEAVQLDAALQNNKPSVVEFYAGWCEVCRELAPDVYKVEQEYGKSVNFVMLNIENPKWAPEIAEYRVGGVPHFVFLNSTGQPEAAAVGRLPQQVLEGNVRALSEGTRLPFRGASGVTSSLGGRSQALTGPSQASPRSHS